jgi:hypothetical protein
MMPLPEPTRRTQPLVGRYRVSQAPPQVRALFAAARQWQRCCARFRVDGGPCIGGLAELVVQYWAQAAAQPSPTVGGVNGLS